MTDPTDNPTDPTPAPDPMLQPASKAELYAALDAAESARHRREELKRLWFNGLTYGCAFGFLGAILLFSRR